MAMEKHLRAGESMLDVGTGTGILAQAAVLLGAKAVVACDIETDAASIAYANFQKSGAAIGVFAGSLRSVRTAAFPLAVANLNAATLNQNSGHRIQDAVAGARCSGLHLGYRCPVFLFPFIIRRCGVHR